MVRIAVFAGLCNLEFRPNVSSGREEDGARDGVGFDLESTHPPHEEVLKRNGIRFAGVIPRTEAQKLYDMLGRYLKENDRGRQVR